ncbi:MAG: arginine--tRNA ligase, partial [Acidimicrobiaceae bacterium]|nr:arginine--tRNA ligase [Acidimicrobiaceae bacterium]
MAGLLRTLHDRLQPGFDAVEPGADPVLRPSGRPGVDIQANGAIALARRTGQKPAEVAAKVVAAADLAGVATAEVAPQGFVNLVADDRWLAAQVAALAADPRLGVPAAPQAMTVVVDYSAPNVAKEMHVGHLRTTII